MKTPRPGQLCTINNIVYRAYKRTEDCYGCDLNKFMLCPNIVDRRYEEPPLLCGLKGIIFKRI